MIRKVTGCLSLGLIGLLLCGQAPPPLRELPQSGAVSLSGQEVGRTPEGVHIRVTNRPLQEVLQAIQHVSGVQFSVASTMWTMPVTATIEASDWPTAIQHLLQTFNSAIVWDDSNTRLQQVFILESATLPAGLVVTPQAGAAEVTAE